MKRSLFLSAVLVAALAVAVAITFGHVDVGGAVAQLLHHGDAIGAGLMLANAPVVAPFKRLQALQAKKGEVLTQMRAIHTAAGDGLLTDEQTTQFNALKAQATQIDAGIQQAQDLIAAERAAPGVEIPDDARITTESRAAQLQTHGFATFGEFVTATRVASVGGVRDERLQIGAAAATTYGNEGSLSDGGFLIPPEYSSQVMQHALEEDAWLPLCDVNPVSGNSMSYPKDETTPWGTDGIRAYWEAEAAAATQTKPKGHVNTLRLNKLMALVPVTDELQADAPALGGYIMPKAGDAIRWKSNESLFAGTGAGQPEGLFNSAARIDVAKEVGQAADTVVVQNVSKMFARQLKPGRSVWLINPMVLPQLIVMTIGNQPVWTPPNAGIQGSPLGNLLGRPIISNQHSKVLGDVGDIGFVDFKSMRAISKAGAGVEMAQSMHLWFDQALQAFRFMFRLDAKPWVSAAVAAAQAGGDSLSPFVFLADRA